MLLLAHRGASADAPENTLAAFTEAVAQGADGVELDVMRCGSGELVVCHDERLSRLAGVDWEVAATPYWKLRHADVGSRLGFAPARIPLLEEVVEALPAHFVLNVELKCESADDQGLAVAAGAYLTRAGLTERVVVSSFNALSLFRLAKAFPRLRRGYLLDPDKSHLWHAGLLLPLVASYSVHPSDSACTPARVRAWHQRGLEVAVWTVDSPRRAAELETWGVDYLITNQPRRLRVR
ncbi:MAG: glycerophosphodiester phosphodiesterase [Myxococcota bacterium]